MAAIMRRSQKRSETSSSRAAAAAAIAVASSNLEVRRLGDNFPPSSPRADFSSNRLDLSAGHFPSSASNAPAKLLDSPAAAREMHSAAFVEQSIQRFQSDATALLQQFFDETSKFCPGADAKLAPRLLHASVRSLSRPQKDTPAICTAEQPAIANGNRSAEKSNGMQSSAWPETRQPAAASAGFSWSGSSWPAAQQPSEAAAAPASKTATDSTPAAPAAWDFQPPSRQVAKVEPSPHESDSTSMQRSKLAKSASDTNSALPQTVADLRAHTTHNVAGAAAASALKSTETSSSPGSSRKSPRSARKPRSPGVDRSADEVTRHLLCARSKIEAVELEFAQIMSKLAAYSEHIPASASKVTGTRPVPTVSPPISAKLAGSAGVGRNAEYFFMGTPRTPTDTFGGKSTGRLSSSGAGRQLEGSLGD